MKKISILFLVIGLISSCVSKQKNDMADINLNFLAQNVVIKDKSPYFVTYKYKNVRVDEVATIAALYCSEYNLQAYLRDVILAPDHSRLATFDCVKLNIKK